MAPDAHRPVVLGFQAVRTLVRVHMLLGIAVVVGPVSRLATALDANMGTSATVLSLHSPVRLDISACVTEPSGVLLATDVTAFSAALDVVALDVAAGTSRWAALPDRALLATSIVAAALAAFPRGWDLNAVDVHPSSDRAQAAPSLYGDLPEGHELVLEAAPHPLTVLVQSRSGSPVTCR